MVFKLSYNAIAASREEIPSGIINQETPHSQDVVKVILVRRECGDEWILIRTTVLCGTLYA